MSVYPFGNSLLENIGNGEEKDLKDQDMADRMLSENSKGGISDCPIGLTYLRLEYL